MRFVLGVLSVFHGLIGLLFTVAAAACALHPLYLPELERLYMQPVSEDALRDLPNFGMLKLFVLSGDAARLATGSALVFSLLSITAWLTVGVWKTLRRGPENDGLRHVPKLLFACFLAAFARTALTTSDYWKLPLASALSALPEATVGKTFAADSQAAVSLLSMIVPTFNGGIALVLAALSFAALSYRQRQSRATAVSA